MLGLDRIEIESVGSDPVRLARALLRQLPELTGRVPIDAIALALDIVEIREARLESLEACLQCDRLKSEGQIVVNAGSGPRRRRFSIAHELGHFLNERHRPTSTESFECTAEDMTSPSRKGRHLRQELEANTFAIEVLAPRQFLGRHLNPLPDLEHALALADRFEISRIAAVRRYVELHEERIAAVFSKDGRIRWVEKPEGFPATTVWTGDPIPDGALLASNGSDLSDLDRVDEEAWLRAPFGIDLFTQTLFQQEGYAITLLLAEATEQESPVPRFRRSNRKP